MTYDHYQVYIDPGILEGIPMWNFNLISVDIWRVNLTDQPLWNEGNLLHMQKQRRFKYLKESAHMIGYDDPLSSRSRNKNEYDMEAAS